MNLRKNFLNDLHHGAILRRWILNIPIIDYAAVELKVESRVKALKFFFLYSIIFQLKELVKNQSIIIKIISSFDLKEKEKK